MVVEFKGRWFAKDVILQCIRWYLAYKLSYRDLEEMMAERGLCVDNSTIQRWVTRYSSALEMEFRRGKRPVGGSWRMNETYIKVKGTCKYLYRVVDKCGKTVEFLLSAKRDSHAASRFFRKAMDSSGVPHKLTLESRRECDRAADVVRRAIAAVARHAGEG